MTLIGKFRRWLSAAQPVDDGPARILIFGDSHSHAIAQAVDSRGDPTIRVIRRAREEALDPRREIMSFENFLSEIARCRPQDLVVSVLSGNFHLMVSTLEHARSFDMLDYGQDAADNKASEYIPRRAMESYFEQSIARKESDRLRLMKAATTARLAHLSSPPPKYDNDHIARHHAKNLGSKKNDYGIASPDKRLRFFLLHQRIAEAHCDALGVDYLRPPPQAVNPKGFLRKKYWRSDASHGNRDYGALVVDQLVALREDHLGNLGGA